MPDTPAEAGTGRAEPRAEYQRRLDERLTAHAALDRTHERVGYTRAAIAVAGIATMVALLLDRAPFSGWWLLAIVPVLVALGLWLDRLEARAAAIARSMHFYRRGLARIDGGWPGTGPAGARFIDEHHIYACDLDLFGRGSLFDLLCNARTPMGEETLASWLLNPSLPVVARSRQDAVRDLSPRLDFLERLGTAAGGAGIGAGNASGSASLRGWAVRALELQNIGWRTAAWVMTGAGAVAIAAIITYLTSMVEVVVLDADTLDWLRLYFIPVVLTLLIVQRRGRRETARIIAQAESATTNLDLIEQAVVVVEAESFTAPRLVALHAALAAGGRPASWWMARLRRLVTIADMRRNWFVKILGPLLLFDFHVACRLEDWRRVSGASVAPWLDAVGEAEALASLAAYHYGHPGHTFPEFVESAAARLEAIAIGHPLLGSAAHTVVTNDFSIAPPLQALIVSGSNMSGKSTLLRTLGINVVLAQAGAPVYAQRMTLSPLAIGTSIRIQDSLQEGVSRFYAEIQRLKQIVDAARNHPPLLFLIDEFLHGTNSHDRQVGATAIVRGLVDRGAIGLITTHDLALTHIADTLGARAANVHFQDEMKDGRLHFDYVMRPGIVTRSNAIELMRSVGLEI